MPEDDKIVIQITDGVDPAVASNIKNIGAAARETDGYIKALKASLASIGASGLSGLKKQIDDSTSATKQLSTATSELQTKSASASTSVENLTTSLQNSTSASTRVAAANQAVSASLQTQLSLFDQITPAVTTNAAQMDLFALQITNTSTALEKSVPLTTAAAASATELAAAQGDALAVNALLSQELNQGAVWLENYGAASKIATTSVQELNSSFLQSNMASKSTAAATAEVTAANEASVGITKEATAANTELAAATTSLSEVQSRLAVTDIEIAAAKKAIRTATAELVQVQLQLGGADSVSNQQGQALIAEYKQKQAAAIQLLGTLKALRAEMALQERALNNTGKAALGTVSPLQATSGAIRVLEGNFGTNVRAAENFIAKILGLGPIMQAAFPVFGALALIGVIDILAEHVGKVITAFKELSVEARNAEVAAILAGDKILKAKPEGFLTAANLAKAVAGAPPNQQIEITNARETLKDLQEQMQIARAEARRDEAGLQGDALQQQKIKDANRELEILAQQKKTVDDLRNSYAALLTAKTTSQQYIPGSGLAPGTGTFVTNTTPTITDQGQIKAIEEQLRTARDAGREMNAQMIEMGFNIDALGRGEGLKIVGDQIKAAKAQMKLFDEQMADLKTNKGGVVTPQDKLALLQQQLAQALPQNQVELKGRIGVETQEIERQKVSIEALKERYADMAGSIGVYSEALREKQMIDKLDLDILKQHLSVDADTRQGIIDNIKKVVENTRYEKELKGVYEQANGPLKNYQAATKAINDLRADGAISTEQQVIAQNEANRAYQAAIDPLMKYKEAWQDEISLLGKYGDALTVANQIQQIQNDLRSKGRALTDQQRQSLTQYLTTLEHDKEIQTEVNNLFLQNEGAVVKLTRALLALNQAKRAGIISEEQYRVGLAKTKVELADVQIEMGKGTKGSFLTSVFGGYLKDYKGFTVGVTKLWKDAFQTIADGAADSLGRALVYGENLGDALKDVARQALAALISGMIKLGIQTLISTVIAHTALDGITTASLISAELLSAAWWPVAEAVSLASFGANAAPAAAGMISTATLGTILSAIPGFKDGGFVQGKSGIDKIPAWLTDGEFVMNTTAVQNIGVPTLQAMNEGAQMVNSAVGTPSGSHFGGNVNVNVIHDGSTHVEVVKQSDGQIEVIAKRVAIQAVREHAPRAVAQDLHDANSVTSKAMKRTKTVRELR
jgi:hypothetical protein